MIRTCYVVFLIVACLAARPCDAQSWSRDSAGQLVIEPVPVDAALRNEWPAEWEREFWERANYVVEQTARDGKYGNTFFENEKRAYGWAMLSILGGYERPAVEFLQSPDNPGDWSRHTRGIDLYPCFTLKQQVRKYFFFGDALDDNYRRTMRDAIDVWTSQDPLRRPNPAYTGAKVGWGPDKFNSWVDVRSTDNLKLMREVAAYLFAEEAGNERTRNIYRARLVDFSTTLYYQGQGEWDSENYLGHSIAPLLCLYDFADDREMQALAKASLDWMTTCAAIKYWRGNYNGPCRRDYNHPYPFGGSAAAMCWLWFGDSPQPNTHFESDEVHIITSSYRPPAAVVALARKQFVRPAEITSGKPAWSCWEDLNAAAPEQYETHYFGKTFQFGTLLQGTQSPDINGFKALVYSTERGADTMVAAPVSDPLKIGSPQYVDGAVAPHGAVGQNGNVAVYLSRQSDHPFLMLVPRDATVTHHETVTIVDCERTTIALWPVNLSPLAEDRELTDTVQWREKNGNREPRWPESIVLRGDRTAGGNYGFAIEFCEVQREQFAQQAAQLAPELVGKPDNLAAAITGVGGRRVRVQWGETPQSIGVWRDGRQRQIEKPSEQAIFRTISSTSLVDQAWQSDGRLRVVAGGYEFGSQVERSGRVTFSQQAQRPR